MKTFHVRLEREDGKVWEKEIEATDFQKAGARAPIFMPKGFGNCMEVTTFVNGKRWLFNA